MLGNRIKRARKALGFSLRDLADKVSLSHAAIKKYEDDEVTPASDVLLKIAKALHVRTEYFFRPAQFTLEDIRYRKHADMSERHLEEITAKILDQVERRVELENLFPNTPIQAFAIKNLPKEISSIDDIEALADQVREQWNLGRDPIPNLVEIFEEHGIKVFEIDNRTYPKFDGLYANVNGMPVIVIGDQWPGDRQRFTLAHELGHLLLDNYGLVEIENYCNQFAGAFLIPKKSLINVLGEHRNSIEPRELSLLKQDFGISMTSLLHRAEETRIISNSLYRHLRTEFNQQGWSKKEPGEQYPKQKAHMFEQMIFRALAEEYIGESKAAELMNRSLESFRSLRAMENQDVVHHQ